MPIAAHSRSKYVTGTLLDVEHDAERLRVETWRHGPGRLHDTRLQVTEVAVMLRGHVRVERTGDGHRQCSFAGPGSFWLCPAGVDERDVLVSDVMEEVIHFFLPSHLIGASALEEFGVDPTTVRLDYAGGRVDPLMRQIGLSFRGIRRAPVGLTDDLFAQSMGTALAAHLLRSYLAGSRSLAHSPPRKERLDARRVQRVMDLVESQLAERIQLSDMAQVACLSPFHFSRIFRETMGTTPYQYVLDRRIEGAKRLLCSSDLDVGEIALSMGFGTASNFNRAFRKATGTTPGAFVANR